VTPEDDNDSILYEVSLEAQAAIEAEFDTWLRDHIAGLLQFRGFLSAEILDDATAPPGKVRRIVLYRLRDRAALEHYLRHHEPPMQAQGLGQFGERFSIERRVLAHREEFTHGAVSTENCLNCGEVLTGQHCAHCGQRAKARVLSLASLARDVFGDLTNFDSRLWRTLRPLAFKPGFLTLEFLRGRRMYYTPPVRMYLIVSFAFFLLASLGADLGGDWLKLDTKNGATLQFGDDPKTPAQADVWQASPPLAAQPAAPLDPERRKIVETIVAKLPPQERTGARLKLEAELAKMKPADVDSVKRVVDDPCGEQNFKVDIGPLGEKYTPRLRGACRKIVSDSKGFGRALYENVPKMMFIFLPLVAAVMYLLYIGSGRYYVEHLLFFVHFHAFFFLGAGLIVLLGRGAALLGGTGLGRGLGTAERWAATAFAFYVPYYLFRAMRRVYGQGRGTTLLKYSLLGVGYVFFMVLTFVGLLFYTALSL